MDYPTLSQRIGSTCALALLLEVAATPKPGLVDRLTNGAHTDMDFPTFLASTTAIAPYFAFCARQGLSLPAPPDQTTLSRIRPQGALCEGEMLAATGGVNTHKGAIFSMGILACAAGACAARGDLSPEAVCAAAAVIAAPAAEDFARPVPPEQTTTGRILYRSRGITGIRGEAASGFASARQWALPVLEEFSGRSYPENDVHLHALLHLMANVCDTNILARGGPEGLDYLHASAKEVLALGGALTPAGKARLGKLDGEFTRRGLSPGGCADLLSVAILLHRLPALIPPGEEGNAHE